MAKRVIGSFLFLMLFASSVQAQIKIDVKTSIDQKRQLTIVKNALVLLLNHSQRYKVVEVGENYSLWITYLNTQVFRGQHFITAELQVKDTSLFYAW
jgi:hypothetical protein